MGSFVIAIVLHHATVLCKLFEARLTGDHLVNLSINALLSRSLAALARKGVKAVAWRCSTKNSF